MQGSRQKFPPNHLYLSIRISLKRQYRKYGVTFCRTHTLKFSSPAICYACVCRVWAAGAAAPRHRGGGQERASAVRRHWPPDANGGLEQGAGRSHPAGVVARCVPSQSHPGSPRCPPSPALNPALCFAARSQLRQQPHAQHHQDHPGAHGRVHVHRQQRRPARGQPDVPARGAL